jgi:hypothetical protein
MSRGVSTPRAVRLPDDLDTAVIAACGGDPKDFGEWARNVFRRAVGRPLNYEAGYQEGKMKGWSEANEKFRAAVLKAKATI